VSFRGGFGRYLYVVVLASATVFAFETARAGQATPVNGVPDENQSREVLSQALAGFPGAERGQVIPLAEATIEQTFPGHRFYVLRFRRYPVAVVPPAPLEASNVFVVKPDGSVARLSDTRALEAFFQSALAPVTTDADAKEAARAWLRLVEEFHQDGFLQFSIPEASLQAAPTPGGGHEATGKAIVNPQGGNRGEVTSILTFDPAGRLVSASTSATIKRGIRPICQATKLLDPDPVVRRMAEQDLLLMGRAAKPYLDEQRAIASPELQGAIDRVWQQILREGW
jgi:hypothetical protein